MTSQVVRARPLPARGRLSVAPIDTPQAFEELALAWTQLAAEAGQTSPFLSHDWFRCCWQAAAPEERPEILVVKDETGPVAFVPLVRRTERRRGVAVRSLRLLDSPDTPFIEFLASPEPRGITEVVLDALAARRDWDVLTLQKLPLESPTLKALEGALAGRRRVTRGAMLRSPYVAIDGTWEEYFRTQKTQRFRKTVRNIENRLHRGHRVEVQELSTVDPDGPVMAEVMEVSRQSWKGARGLAMATMRGMPTFFHELTRRASANGWLRVWILRLDGRAVATEYQIVADGRVHALRADFDPSLADLSPGAYLNQRIVQALFEGGKVHEYDMGPGDRLYKARWASGAHETATLVIFRSSVRGLMLHTIESRIAPAARRMRKLVTRWRQGREVTE
jgi:CelD/BcsL family acetyltransferase involved in cellulose biosynthesis